MNRRTIITTITERSQPHSRRESSASGMTPSVL